MRISDWSSDVCSSDLFTEGDQVRAGQALYQIDPAPYEAQVANARAALVRARSSIASTAALARRYNDLVKINAISRQEAENAVTSPQQAEADVSAQQPMLPAAQLDLARPTHRHPSSGDRKSVGSVKGAAVRGISGGWC